MLGPGVRGRGGGDDIDYGSKIDPPSRLLNRSRPGILSRKQNGRRLGFPQVNNWHHALDGGGNAGPLLHLTPGGGGKYPQIPPPRGSQTLGNA